MNIPIEGLIPGSNPTLADFAALPRWVAWRTLVRNGKPTKIPFYAVGREAEADNPATWLTHDRAVAVAEAIVNGAGGGVGIELGQHNDGWVCGVDLDSCRDPKSGALTSWAATVLERFDTYAEVSPSGTGVKLFLQIDPADIEPLRRIMGTQHGRKFSAANDGGHGPAIELYTSNRYFAVTWEGLEDSPVELRQVPLDDLRWLIDHASHIFPRKKDNIGGNDQSRSAIAFRKGAALRRAGKTYDQMVEALRADPETADWVGEKGDAANGRELRRIWERAGAANDAEWDEPVDFLADADITGTPELKPDHIPVAIAPFVFDTAARMGTDPAAVALGCLVSLASIISDEWRIQPKAYDTTWTEQPRLWGATVGDPSILKSPVIAACTRPIDRLEIEARKHHAEAVTRYKAEMVEWKKNKEGDEPRHPALDRYMVESLTIEALSEVLRGDIDVKQRAPAGKVLVRSDELAELLGNLDRYNAGGRGGGDRGAYLRLFNGGRYTVDRVVRGHFACPNWSACILGGIQPGPIQRIAREAADDGLLQRFCYCVPANQNGGLDRAPNYDGIRQYEALFPYLAALLPGREGEYDTSQNVCLHADAHKHRQSLDELVTALKAMPDITLRMKAALGKFPGIYARLCLVFHLIECAAERMAGQPGRSFLVVTADTAKRAMLYLRDILLPHLTRAEAVMYLTTQTGHARWIAGFILSRDFTRVTRRDITRAYGLLRAPEHARELTSVMNGLEALGWVREETPENPARLPAAWIVNPKVGQFAELGEQERQRRKQAQEANVRQWSR